MGILSKIEQIKGDITKLATADMLEISDFVAQVNGTSPDDLIREFHKNRGSGDPMPVVIG